MILLAVTDWTKPQPIVIMTDKLGLNPDRQIPDLTDKVILVTGGTNGLGRATLLALASHKPATLIFTGRNAANGDVTERSIFATDPVVNIIYLQCDQADLHSVAAAMRKLIEKIDRLDIMLCNAGVMGKDAALTVNGYEYHFGVNHLAHALMIEMLLPLLKNTSDRYGDARVVLVASNAFSLTPPGGIVFEQLKTVQDMAIAGRWRRYGQSKLANVAYAAELSERFPKISAISIHPGVVWTDLWNTDMGFVNRAFIWLVTLGQNVSVEEGILNHCWAATTPKANLIPGAYYEPVGVQGKQSKDSSNQDLRQQLWSWTAEQLREYV